MGVNFIQLVADELQYRFGSFKNSEKAAIRNIVLHALNQTRTHIARTRNEKGDIPSAILSNIWQTASQDLLKYKGEQIRHFAMILEMKSKYWSDPKGFNLGLLDEYEMRLNQVEQELNLLTQ